MMMSSLIERDLNHIWHPCAQMKDYAAFPPLEVVGAQGSYIELSDGRKIIDAISSWWCKSLGHQHPRLKKALLQQVERFEHVLLAHTTHAIIVELSEKLAKLTLHLNKVMYASDGSCAVEIAMKMSLHARQVQGQSHRTQFIALENAYHGETVGALSVSDLGMYRQPYLPLLFNTHWLTNLPYVESSQDPLWDNCELHWRAIEKQLKPLSETTTAILVEPIVQGAAGMKIYSRDFLKRLRAFATRHDIHLIADEIMTGIGRTGKMLACDHAGIEPDFLCLAKGLASGWLPLSAVLTSQAMYDVFYDDYASGKSFLHSHTHSGNALAASVANEVLAIMQEERLCERAAAMGDIMRNHLQDIADRTQRLTKVRALGAIAAADIIPSSPQERAGFAVYQKASQLGAILRPLGNTIYWLPPLTTDDETLLKLKEITEKAL